MKIIYNKLLLLIFLFFTSSLFAQFQTRNISKSISSLRISLDGQATSNPIIQLNGQMRVKLSFDELDTPIQNYYYKVQHCNSDWTLSSISSMEWGDGFNENPIEEVSTSANTHVSYTHYELTLPNENLNFKLSGNYVISVYDINSPDVIVATACFYVMENLISINANIKSNTTLGTNTKYQQLDFDINTGNFPIENPMSDLKVNIQQNDRTDNQITNLQANYLGQGKLSFTNNKALVFEGGCEYNSFDFSSQYSFSGCIDKIKFFEPYYHVELLPDIIDPWAGYSDVPDVNGKYVVNIQEYDEDETFADYYMVHFSLPAKSPFFDGLVYVLGDFNNNRLDKRVQMRYNNQTKQYEQNILLKQGGYNYQYVFVKKGTKAGSFLRIGGSHWQTENLYSIYVYYRSFGDRYDRLIGVKTLYSGA